MNRIRKIISILLVMCTLTGTFAGCAGADEEVEREYITAGEFYALFAENYNMYDENYTQENIDDYKKAEYMIYNMWLLDEEQLNKYDDLVTKEIVVQVCIRNMEFRETCTVNNIKDIEKCYDQQAIIDAVGMGIVELENGYFDAQQNMTIEECQNIIDKVDEIEMNSQYEEGELEPSFKDDVVVLDDTVEIIEFGVIESQDEATETTTVSKNVNVEVSTLGYKNNIKATTTKTGAKTDMLYFTIKRSQYDLYKSNYKIGKVVILPYYSSNNTGGYNLAYDFSSPPALKISEIVDIGGPNVTIRGLRASFEEFLADENVENGLNKANTACGSETIQLDSGSVPKGIKVDTKSKPGSVIVTFGHTFTTTDPIYGKQTWRNPSASPEMNVKVEIGNFKLQTKNLGKLLLGKKANARVALTYNSKFNLNLQAGGLRYSPANNGNGGLKYSPDKGFSGNFLANVGNSRFTGASAGGSERIKLAQVRIPLGYGFSLNANLYMMILLDGTIAFAINAKNEAELKLTKNRNGNCTPTFNLSSQKNEAAQVNANLTLELQLTPNISFMGAQIIDAVGAIGGQIDAMASVYSVEGKKSSNKFYATQTELSEQCSDGKFLYCIGSSFEVYLRYQFLTTDSVIGKFVINELGMKTPSDKVTLHYSCSHFEDGAFTKDGICTRKDGEVDVSGDKEIHLDTYKLVMNEGSCSSVLVDAFPVKEKTIKDNGGVKVASENKKVATAAYNEATDTILVTAVGEGSTEITIKVPMNKKKKGKKQKFYEQKVSVTVSKNNVTETSAVNGGQVVYLNYPLSSMLMEV